MPNTDNTLESDFVPVTVPISVGLLSGTVEGIALGLTNYVRKRPTETQDYGSIKTCAITIEIDRKHLETHSQTGLGQIKEGSIIKDTDITISDDELKRIRSIMEDQKHNDEKDDELKSQSPAGQIGGYIDLQLGLNKNRNEADSSLFFRENAAKIIGGYGGVIIGGFLAVGLLFAFTPIGWGLLSIAGVIAGAAVAGGLIGLAIGAIIDSERMNYGSGGDDQEDTTVTADIFSDISRTGSSPKFTHGHNAGIMSSPVANNDLNNDNHSSVAGPSHGFN